MGLHRETLPYEIRKTACELYAGKTGFSQEEMKAFFTEEIHKVVQPPSPFPIDTSTFLGRLANAMQEMGDEQRLSPQPFPTRAKAFEYWLSFLPLRRQKELLLELCQKPNFPMSSGKPSLQQRQRLIAMLTDFVIDPHVSSVLQKLDSAYIMNTWKKAIERCESDPQGAITAARTLLESLCKHMLEACRYSYDEKADLPKLYSVLAKELKIAPSLQSEQSFKRIFGGCQSIIQGIGELRNELSDAHGKGRANEAPAPYHAAFAVNLAGAVAMFLLQTWEADQRVVLSISVEN